MVKHHIKLHQLVNNINEIADTIDAQFPEVTTPNEDFSSAIASALRQLATAISNADAGE